MYSSTRNGHLLIIPKKHFTDFTELDNETLNHINETSKLMKDLLYKKLNAVGLKICVNYGIAQEIKHYHMHLKPYYKENNGISVEGSKRKWKSCNENYVL